MERTNLPQRTKSENTLIGKLKQYPKIRELKNDMPIKQALVYCYNLIGLKEYPSQIEDQLLNNFIRQQYPELIAEEIKDAFDMAISRKIEVDVNCYGKFSPEYLGRIMSAYKQWRQREMTKPDHRPRHEKYKDEQDYLEKELFAPYQRMRQGEVVHFSPYQEWRLFNYLHNKGIIHVEDPEAWREKAFDDLIRERRKDRKKGSSIRYRPEEGSIDYRARQLYFRQWIQEKAFEEANMREILKK